MNTATTDFGWLHDISNFYVGGYSFDDGEKNTGVFDSFWPGIHLPTTEWGYLLQNWTGNANMSQYLQCSSTTYKCGFIGMCSQHMSDFTYIGFNFKDDRVYQILPSDYMRDTSDSQGRNWCDIGIYGSNSTRFILGDVFMQSLYVMLDYDNSQFALNGNWVHASTMYTQKRFPDAPTDDGTGGSNKSIVWVIIGSVLGVLVAVAAIGIFIVRRKNRRLQQNLEKYETL